MGSGWTRGLALTGVVLAGGMFGVGYGLVQLNASRTLAEQVYDRLSQNSERIEKIESLVLELENQHRNISTTPSSNSQEKLPQALNQRLDSLERTVDKLTAEKQLAVNQSRAEESDKRDDRSAFSFDQNVVPNQSVSMLHDEEWGQSAWGEASAAEITQAFPNEPFFSKYGGDLVADCKQTTCKLEWFIPNVGSLTPDERETMLAMTNYELMALAARYASDVGVLDTQWELEGNQPRVILHFKRNMSIK